MQTFMLIRLAGYAAIALLVFGVVAVVGTGRKPAHIQGLTMPVLAMEFVETDAELHAIIGPPGTREAKFLDGRRWLTTGIRFDYGFIALYWLLFVLMAGVLARRDGPWMWLGAAAALAITGAAVFDAVENVRMTRVIESARLAGIDVAFAGFAKWLLSFVAIGLLSFVFLAQRGWIPLIGVLCVAIAGVGLAGLVALRMGPGGLPLIHRAFQGMTMALLPLTALAFTLFRRSFTG